MNNIINSYNQALDFLHHEKYEEALKLLDQINHSNHPQIKWTLGLVYVMVGYPFKALDYWEGISEEDIPSISTSKHNVQTKLALYEELYEKYNNALLYVNANKIQEAISLFQEFLAFKEEVPLPVEFYQGYILSKIVTSEEKAVITEIDAFPSYIKNHSVIYTIQAKLRGSKAEVSDTTTIRTSGRKIKGVIYGVGIAASIMIGALTMNYLGESEATIAPSEEKVIASEETTNYRSQVAVLEGTVNDLKVKQQKLLTEIENKDLKIKEQATVQELLVAADIEIESIASKAGLSSYKKGIQAYKDGNYQEAISYFNQSNSIMPNEYFSDDTIYYLIQSSKKSNQTEGLMSWYDAFLLEKGAHFTSSPYVDDVLLEKAELLVALGNIDEAMILLELLQEEFSE